MSMDPVLFQRPHSTVGSQPLSRTVQDSGVTITDQFQQSNLSIQAGGEGYTPMAGGQGVPVTQADGIDTDTYPRPMIDEEKKNFKVYFPALDVDRAVVSAPATEDYNCISWTVGETHQWFWPPSMYPNIDPEAAFDKFMGDYGLIPGPPGVEGEVAHWMDSNGPTHGSIRGTSHGPRWESKCGQELRIQHDRDELEGEIYGKITRYYVRKEDKSSVQPGSRPPEVPDEVKTSVQEIAKAVPAVLKEEFEQNYREWQAYRQSPRVKMFSDPALHCTTAAFDRIVAMGEAVVPLLMEKIAGGDFFSYRAFERIEKNTPDNGYRIATKAVKAEDTAVSEQTRALRALLNWHQTV
jgi:hypothetical protein